MSTLEIIKFPDPRLHIVSQPVLQFDEELHKLLDAMASTMYGANGVGLAAPQVGRTIRAFVIDITWAREDATKKLYEFINPKIVSATGKIAFEEGCLSVPGVSEEVQRKNEVRVEYVDRDGKPQVLAAEGLLAVAVQHENDHLDGILFVDRLSPLKRRLTRRRLEKAVTL